MLLQPYNTEWAMHFNAIKTALDNALQPLPIIIEHVGSTAIPLLAAKPIIDIDIVFNEATCNFSNIKSKLASIGYYHNGNQGIADREVFKRKLLAHHPILDTTLHHLYVCSSNSKALQKHLTFRDHLRNNEADRNAYQALKLTIAEASKQDKKLYAAFKEIQATGFINGIINQYL
ncbi:MAG: GrpB family protein [Flavobacterium sp.]|nr:GrpB family protein [Flavobacterium sp.]